LLIFFTKKMATADFIIIGGGIGGCVLASRLHQKYPSASILLIEAGPDVSNHPMIVNSTATPILQHSELDWDYKTVPQKHLDNKICFGAAGKALGGGSAINGCMFYANEHHVILFNLNRWLATRR
jgi:choline dehydrogenase-like flavoprotein